jgi:hypothetical protein
MPVFWEMRLLRILPRILIAIVWTLAARACGPRDARPSFLASWEVTTMMTLRLVSRVALAALIPLAIAQPAAAIRILMHGRLDVPAFGDDQFVFEHLEQEFGADNVDYIMGSMAAADGSSANGYDVLFISSTMASGDTRGKYADSPVGIVCDENALIHDNNVGNFMLSDAGGNQNMVDDRQKLRILNPTHPLAAGLSGEITVFKTPVANWWQYGLGDLGTGVSLIADEVLPASDPPPAPQHAIFAADVGAMLRGDGSPGSPMTAAGRRVFFFMSDFGAFDLTDDGFKLFDAAIEWAAAKPTPALVGDYNSNGAVDAADYALWRDGGPLQNEGATPGSATSADYDIWRANFGKAPGSSAGALVVSAVPEPTAGALAQISALLLAAFGRPRGNKWRNPA